MIRDRWIQAWPRVRTDNQIVGLTTLGERPRCLKRDREARVSDTPVSRWRPTDRRGAGSVDQSSRAAADRDRRGDNAQGDYYAADLLTYRSDTPLEVRQRYIDLVGKGRDCGARIDRPIVAEVG